MLFVLKYGMEIEQKFPLSFSAPFFLSSAFLFHPLNRIDISLVLKWKSNRNLPLYFSAPFFLSSALSIVSFYFIQYSRYLTFLLILKCKMEIEEESPLCFFVSFFFSSALPILSFYIYPLTRIDIWSFKISITM